MLEYLDTVGCDSDFILKSDIDDTSEKEEDASHDTLPAAHPVPDSEEDDMMKITGKFSKLSNFFLYLSNSNYSLDLSICLLLILLLLLTSISSSQT
jgi:hypothetical protein